MTYHLAWNLGIKKFKIYIIILLLSHYRKNRVHLGKILKLENASSWLENKIKWDKKGKKINHMLPLRRYGAMKMKLLFYQGRNQLIKEKEILIIKFYNFVTNQQNKIKNSWKLTFGSIPFFGIVPCSKQLHLRHSILLKLRI